MTLGSKPRILMLVICLFMLFPGPISAQPCALALETGHHRADIFAKVLRANVEVPQIDSYISLQAFASFLLNPIPAEELLAPVSEIEAETIANTMNRVHGAFGVSVRTEGAGDARRHITRDALAQYPRHTFLRTFRNLVRLIEVFQPRASAGENLGHLAREEVADRPDARSLVDSFFTAEVSASARAEVQARARRLRSILESEEMKNIAKVYRLEIRAAVTAGASEKDLHDQIRAPSGKVAGGIFELLKKEFLKNESDIKFMKILFQVFYMDALRGN